MKSSIRDEPSARTEPIWPLVLTRLSAALLIFVFSTYEGLTHWFVGWPDGLVTDLQLAEETLATYFFVISQAIAFWLVILAVSARRFTDRKLDGYTVIFYLALIAVTIAIDRYLALFLDNFHAC